MLPLCSLPTFSSFDRFDTPTNFVREKFVNELISFLSLLTVNGETYAFLVSIFVVVGDVAGERFAKFKLDGDRRIGESPLKRLLLDPERTSEPEHSPTIFTYGDRSTIDIVILITRSPVVMISRYRCRNIIFLTACFFLQVPDCVHVHGHGRLMDPPARNSMWRFGYPNPVNYNDNELFCGGYAVQWVENKGQCGVCGDAYHLKEPRPHEAGGEYAKGTIVRHYTVGQDIDVEIELTANHLGRFEMYLCPNNNPRQVASQECFDRYPLYVSGTRDVGFEIPVDTERKAIFRYKVTLPPYVTCTQCVVQWNYYTGNMWGTCENGTEANGCGRPETFRNCADVSIVTSTAGVPPLFVQQDNPFLLYYKDYRSPNDIFPLVVRSQVCLSTSLYRRIPGMSDWCQTNCLRYPPNCPAAICQCPEVCDAIGDIAGKDGASVYCMDKCLVYPSNCPSERCRCY